MKLNTDLAIKKWKPKSKGERASCGQSLYIQGWDNGNRAWVYRLLVPTAHGKQHKTVWLTIGQPAADKEHGIAGGSLRLAEARELAMRISGAVKRGEASPDQIKRVLTKTAPLAEFDDLIRKPSLEPIADMDIRKVPTFDQMFQRWYDLQRKSNRWTHPASIRRPMGAYENHAREVFGYMPIDKINRRMVFETLQAVFVDHTKTASDLRIYVDETFELALDLEIIEHNPCPPLKKFTLPKRKERHHGALDANRLPELYEYIMNGKSDATFKAAMIMLVVSGLRVANIAFLRQEHYDPETGKFTIPEKEDDDHRRGFMKTGGEYSNVLPPELRDMINAQLIEGHEFVFVSRQNLRNVNPESLRKNFKHFDPTITAHGFRNCFKQWAYNSEIDHWLADRYCDHSLKGLDKAYRRFDTIEARTDVARRYFEYFKTGATPAPLQQPALRLVS